MYMWVTFRITQENMSDAPPLSGRALIHWGRDNVRHFVDDIFKCIFMNENFCILSEISVMFVPTGPNGNNSA